jgi:hypothetical protein
MGSQDEVRENAVYDPDEDDCLSEDQLEAEEEFRDGEYNAENVEEHRNRQ